MDIKDMFSSNYLKTSDLKGRRIVLAIDKVSVEDIGKEKKPVLYFVDKEKGMVLNRTNATTIEEIVGTSETRKWHGKKIILYPTRVDFQGRRVDAMRVDALDGQSKSHDDEWEGDAPAEDDAEDDISF